MRSSRAIYQRCGRLCDVVTADMERFEAGPFTERVLDSVRVLRREIMPVFSRRVSDMIRVRRGGGLGYCSNLTLYLCIIIFRMHEIRRKLTKMTLSTRVGWCTMVFGT